MPAAAGAHAGGKAQTAHSYHVTDSFGDKCREEKGSRVRPRGRERGWETVPERGTREPRPL